MLRSFFIVFLFLIASIKVYAEVNEKTKSKILAGLQEGRPDTEVTRITESVIAELYRVEVKNGPVLYADGQGKHFIVGEMYAVIEGSFANLDEKAREAKRVEQFAQLDQTKLIKYPPDTESKGHIHVYTDVACPNCRRFHKEFLPVAAARGIEVRYLAYPIIGGEDSRKRMISAWCSPDPKASLTKLKTGETLKEASCDSHPVNDHYKLGREMQISGTPAVFLPNGERVNLRYLEQTIIRYFDSKNR